jgi:hypothetical protein
LKTHYDDDRQGRAIWTRGEYRIVVVLDLIMNLIASITVASAERGRDSPRGRYGHAPETQMYSSALIILVRAAPSLRSGVLAALGWVSGNHLHGVAVDFADFHPL